MAEASVLVWGPALTVKAVFAAAEGGSEVQQVLAAASVAAPVSAAAPGAFRQADSGLVSFVVARGQGWRVLASGRAEWWQVVSCHLPAADSCWAGLVSPAVSLGSAARASVEWLAGLVQAASCHLPGADLCPAGLACPVKAALSHSEVWAWAWLSVGSACPVSVCAQAADCHSKEVYGPVGCSGPMACDWVDGAPERAVDNSVDDSANCHRIPDGQNNVRVADGTTRWADGTDFPTRQRRCGCNRHVPTTIPIPIRPIPTAGC